MGKKEDMNICYLANSRFPSERAHMTQIVHMCNAFSRTGTHVTLLVTDRKTTITDAPEAFFGMKLLFTIDRIAVPDMAGISPHIPRFLHRFTFSIQRLVYAFKAYQHVTHNAYTYVYGRDEWILYILATLGVRNLVWESHEARYSLAARKLLPHIPVVVISEGIRDFYVRKGHDAKNILVAYDAIDERFFEVSKETADARRLLGIRDEKPVALYVGGLESWKGAEIFCNADPQGNSFGTYVIGGKESEITRFKNMYPHVHFLGSLPYKELPWVQQAADVLVIPNTATEVVGALYTSPLKLFSYMTSHKPIVAARVPSITNVLTEDEAHFFKPDDPRSLREAIVTALSDTEGSVRKSKAAYAKSLRCTWYERARSIIAFLGRDGA